MNSRGQFWSLDIILAAAIFTLAIGLILSSSELSIFYGQQEKNSYQLLSTALLGSNNLVSRNDISLQYLPDLCDPTRGGDPALCTTTPATCPTCIDVHDTTLNIRCGPNPAYSVDTGVDPPVVISSTRGWLSDNELSGLENCIVNNNSPFRTGPLGIFPEFNMDMNAFLEDGTTLSYKMARFTSQDYASFQRRVIAFPSNPTAAELRMCLDGGCSQYLTDLNLRMWRT